MNTAMLVMLLMLPGDADAAKDDALRETANRLAQEFIIVDTHIDVPYRLWKEKDDISMTTEGGDFDFPRAKAGGLDAIFMSIYTPWQYESKGTSTALADSLIDMVQGFVVRWPSKFAVATSVAEVDAIVADDRIALLLGMENGSPIAGKLENLRYFYNRGVRYITLAHSRNNHICDSSYDEQREWDGLSPFGRQVVGEMNRMGIVIDVSHISDDAFYQVMELSKAPVFASHSSCRAFTPGWERNMDDEMIKVMAKNGGVIQLNFGSVFIKDEIRRRYYVGKDKAEQWARENDLDPSDPKVREYRDAYFAENPFGFADVADVVDHIDHVAKLVGVDYVGLGSDFDGVGDSLPTGLKDVSQYPNLIYELLKRDYSEESIRKICSGNTFRVMNEVERVARELSAAR